MQKRWIQKLQKLQILGEMGKLEIIRERREIVDSLDCIGMKPTEILKFLHQKGYTIKYWSVIRDLRMTRKDRKSLLFEGEVDRIRIEYIGAQIEILKRAITNKDYRTASDIVDKIAKARGVDIETIIKIKGDEEHPLLFRKLTDEQLDELARKYLQKGN